MGRGCEGKHNLDGGAALEGALPDDLGADFAAAFANAGTPEVASAAERGGGGIVTAAVVDHAEAELRRRGGDLD